MRRPRHWRCMLAVVVGAWLGSTGVAQQRAIGVSGAKPAATGGSRWAVIIGVNDYQNAPKLRYCVADARLVYRALHERAGFTADRMLLLVDDVPRYRDMPNRENILRHLVDFLSFPEPGDTVLVFFSGHGFRDSDGRGYLAPIDAHKDNPALRCVPIAEVKRLLTACKARRKVLILDTCHSGTAKGGPLDKRVTVGSGRLVEQAAGKGFVTLASCGPDQQSHESEKLGHGVFSYFLAEALEGRADRDRDGWVDFDELYRYAWDHTRRWVYREKRVKQEPLKDVRVQGVMVLARAGAHVPPAPAPPAEPTRPMRPTTPAPTPEPGHAVTNSIGMKLVYIKPGTFTMGSPANEEDRDKDETQHRVTISQGFYMGAYEVTQDEYRKVMGTNPAHSKRGGNYPVDRISWYDAVRFCGKLSRMDDRIYRLPTEAEWEYACRAGSTSAFCFGDPDSRLSAYAWYLSNAGKATHPVGQRRSNAWGLYDMHGNVWERCQDWYAKYGGVAILHFPLERHGSR